MGLIQFARPQEIHVVLQGLTARPGRWIFELE
jgi:hypothetical protein